ncbi:mitochondrial folate transporter/carrier-like isoform X1 [Varroa jacobsoni]|uniref:mitochondrial folate transporter/carrier-like isoform X1 n=2 Tax=Varroa jacobsoni TaxID=62625 RepID=UPI000BF620CA|nr:mitochondrial folate transporter/carrier-like isoform X1 [Varroa jacobsoni]
MGLFEQPQQQHQQQQRHQQQLLEMSSSKTTTRNSSSSSSSSSSSGINKTTSSSLTKNATGPHLIGSSTNSSSHHGHNDSSSSIVSPKTSPAVAAAAVAAIPTASPLSTTTATGTMVPRTRFWQTFLPKLQFEPMLAGIAGGVTSTLILHPLDLLRIRLAVNDGQLKTRPQYLGIRNALTKIVREEGVKGLYRGVFSNCIGNGTSWGLYFLFYHSIKNYMLNSQRRAERSHPSGTQKDVEHLGPARHMLAAAEAGCITQVITNPLSMVKTRLCLQYSDHYMNVPATKRYSGMVDAFQKVVKYEGFSSLYKGLLPGVFNVAHGSIQFMVYEELKAEYSLHVNRHRLTTKEYLIFAAISKLIAAAVTYPQQLIRARLQDQHVQYSGFLEVVRRTQRAEGIKGFYKGFGAYSIHVTPNICIVFLIYEKMYPSKD